MAVARKGRKVVDPNAIPYENMSRSQQIAFDIRATYPDLAPSLQRILDAEDIDEDQRQVAMERFQVALTSPGDPNRDPRHAIAHSHA